MKTALLALAAGVLYGVLFLAALAVSLGPWHVTRPAAKAKTKPDYKQMATVLGPEIVKLVLKHPHDATFTNATASQDHLGRWVTTGLVKAPNGFGLPLTSEWLVAFSEKDGELEMYAVKLDGKYLYVKADAAKQAANSP
jgi:hypothetical protein